MPLSEYYTTDVRILYILNFSVYLITLFGLIVLNSSSNINKYVAFSIVIGTISALIGFAQQWIFRDIMADSIRYIAPFIGFYVGIEFFKYNKLSYIYNFLYISCIIELYLYFYFAIDYLFYIYTTGIVAKYNISTFYTHPLYAILFLIGLKYNIFNKFKIIAVIYILSFAISPLLTLSKAALVSTITVIILIIFNHYSKKAIIPILFVVFIAGIFFETGIVTRLTAAFMAINPDNFSADYSTSYRVIEIINILHNMINDMPSLIWGNGAGSQWTFSYIEYKGGVEKEVFRGGIGNAVHHIFFVYLGYLYRFGILGLLLVLVWLYSTNYYIYKYNNLITNNILRSFAISIIYYSIFSAIWDAFIPVFIFGNIKFGLYLGLGISVIYKHIYEFSNIYKYKLL
jgi:hypothetical protein